MTPPNIVEGTASCAYGAQEVFKIPWDMGNFENPLVESAGWISCTSEPGGVEVFSDKPISETERGHAILTTIGCPLNSAQNNRLVMQLKAIEHTEESERWPEAVWPPKKAFIDAFEFVKLLPLSQIPTPDISLANDGEINFYWNANGVYVDLGIYGTGTLSYFAKKENERKIYGENIPADEGLPHDLKALLMT